MCKNDVHTIRDFADIVGVGRTTVYDLVRGRSTINGVWMKPSLETITRLANVLQKPAHELLYLVEPDALGANVPLAFKIAGDSMDGGKSPIHDGDLVTVDRRIGGEVNGAVVARLNSDGYVCKRLRPGNLLDSSNPDFLDPELTIIMPDRIAEVVGKVVRVIHNTP